MRSLTLQLAVASLFAAGLAPANASPASVSYRLPGVSSLVTHPNVPTKIVARSEAWKYLDPAAVPLFVKQAGNKRHSNLPKRAMRIPGGGPVTSYVTDDSGYIFQLSGKKIVGYSSDCSGAEGIKVDHNQNVWVACTNTFTINMYAPGATSATLSLVDNPGGIDYYASDVAIDGAGDVYATSLYAFSCTTYYCYFYPGVISYWAASDVKNGASPTGTISDPNITDGGYFLDADAQGTSLYVDYSGCTSSGCGYALDKITGTNIVTLIPPGALQFPGGVYVNPNGNINVLDQLALTIGVYDSSGDLINTYGPLTENLEFTCDPVDEGFNLGDTEVAIGDAGCHSQDVGKLAAKHGHGSWKGNANIDYTLPIGSAFTPSDK